MLLRRLAAEYASGLPPPDAPRTPGDAPSLPGDAPSAPPLLMPAACAGELGLPMLYPLCPLGPLCLLASFRTLGVTGASGVLGS
jgi:hypothetical protein